jgi:ribosome-binding ATPase
LCLCTFGPLVLWYYPKMKIGIVGLPNVGKSTLFKALTLKEVDIANYPFCTIDPNVGIVKVPDDRLAKLAKLSKSKKTIPAVIEFVDIAGLVKGAHEGEGLGNEFLSHISMTDAILEIVRLFEDKNVKHVSDKFDPKEDIETIEGELIFKDLAVMKTAVDRLSREAKTNETDKVIRSHFAQNLYAYLNSGKPARSFYKEKLEHLSEVEENLYKELNLLTAKPVLYLFNTAENTTSVSAEKKLKELKLDNLPHVCLSAKLELELSTLSDQEKVELAAPASRLPDLISNCYKLLKLQTYLTTGPDETRAWTIKIGAKAPEAGAAIHTDFIEKFIRAKVVSYDDLIQAGSMALVQTKGRLRTEGKEYIVQEGDVIEFVI